jgi:hypothetical protein
MSEARDQLLHDLFTTGLEGGIGYWCWCKSYRWSTDGGSTPDLHGFRAVICDPEEETDHVVDRKVVAKGYRLATHEWRDKLAWSSSGKPPLVITDDTDWDFDAGDADMIVQLGLFGEVVYG